MTDLSSNDLGWLQSLVDSEDEVIEDMVNQHVAYFSDPVPESERDEWESLRAEVRRMLERGEPRELEIALVLLSNVDRDRSFWPEFVASSDKLDAVTQTLGVRVRAEEVRMQAPVGGVSSQELVDLIERADAQLDWGSLARLIPDVHLVHGSFVFEQAARALATLSPTGLLVEEAKRIDDAIQAIAFVNALDPLDALQVGLAAANGRVSFAATLRTVQPSLDATTADVDNALFQTLVAAATDDENWIRWMDAFNRFPVRYPALQIPLGRALAGVSADALDAYVDSIELSTTLGGSRDQVTRCLQEFSTNASRFLRTALYERAYARWIDWDFGDGLLFGIAFSDLDIALEGWVTTGIPKSDAQQLIDDDVRNLELVERDWHESFNDMQSERLRIVSRIQLFAFALAPDVATVALDSDTGVYLPDVASTPYSHARFPIR